MLLLASSRNKGSACLLASLGLLSAFCLLASLVCFVLSACLLVLLVSSLANGKLSGSEC